MQDIKQLPKLLERTCPNCDAKLDSDLPYCGACGFGLPKFPRPRSVTVGSTVLFFLFGFPAGLLCLYCLAYIILGFWFAIVPLAASGCIFGGFLWLMLEMSEGTRNCRF